MTFTGGYWSLYAGYNVFGDVDPASSASFDTVASASSDKDCALLLNGTGTFYHFLLGNRRFSGAAPIGTYSGNMTAVIGANMKLAGTSSHYVGIVGHNYLQGSMKVVNLNARTLNNYSEIGALTGVTYTPSENTGTITVTVALEGNGDADGNGEISIADVLLSLQSMLNGTKIPAADVNGDGRITLVDILRVMMLAVQ